MGIRGCSGDQSGLGGVGRRGRFSPARSHGATSALAVAALLAISLWYPESKRSIAARRAEFLRRVAGDGRSAMERPRTHARLDVPRQPKPRPARAARPVGLLQSRGTAGANLPGVAAPPAVGRHWRARAGGGGDRRLRPARRANHVLRDRSGRRAHRPKPAILHLPGRFPRQRWKSSWAMPGSRWSMGRRENSTCWWSTCSAPIRCRSI